MASSRPPSLPYPEPFKRAPSPRLIAAGVLLAFILIGLFTGLYQVPANSVAVIQRFGGFLEITQPGLNFKIPFGVDSATIVETRRQMKLEFGYSTPNASNPYQYNQDRAEQEMERNMVSGDLNAAVVEWVVQFHIQDAKDYVFNVYEPQSTLRDLSEAVMREVVGDRTIDEVLTVGREEIELRSLERLQEITRSLYMGIHIDQVQLRNVNPPAEVQFSFDEVNRAQQEKESMINDANGEYNRAVPRARGEAEQKITEAEGYAVKRINEAEGDATRFKALLAQYLKAPEVTRKRIYLETIGAILPTVPNKVIVDDSLPQFLPLMNLRQSGAESPATRAVTAPTPTSTTSKSRK